MLRTSRRPRRTALVLAAAALTAACSATPSAAPSPSPTPFRFDAVTVTGDWGSEPGVQVGDETQSTNSFLVQDIVRGTGPTATSSSRVTVQYVGRAAFSKKTFDSSWARGVPYSFVPGTQTLVAFSEGVTGMRVGGRRLVIVPPSMGFGRTPPVGSGLKADETLVFVIDLVSVA